MNSNKLLILVVILLLFSCQKENNISLKIEHKNPQVDFAIKDLKKSFENNGFLLKKNAETNIKTTIDTSCCEKGGYQILKNTAKEIEIKASESNGLMYGILEVSELISIGKTIEEIQPTTEIPYIKNRGIKYNIPLDIRTSAFDDSGDAAQKNIATMWEFSFWEHFFDNMARNRYNVISFWNAHPFSSMLELEEYPDVALQDVWGTTLDPQKDGGAWTAPELPSIKAVANKKVLKKMTIQEKIAFWQRVMQHAKNRGIDIYYVTWNICLNGAAPLGSNKEAEGKVGKYGITNDFRNEISKDYLRKSVKQFLLTYPHVTGIGVTAGENMRDPMDDNDKEKWLWETYGLGIMDAKEIQKERKVNFIHRFWWTDAEQVAKYWKQYPDQFDMSFKYAKARLYSAPNPTFHTPLLEWMQPLGLKSWWNLRNDDIYIHRWADPTYVSDFIKNLPYEATAGFQMGSDGYVWGKEFISKNPAISGQYEMDKHWMRFLLWGRLSYNPEIDESRFENLIANKFHEIDSQKLFKAWKASSKVIPQINTFHWRDWDYMWQPEANFDCWTSFKDINTFRVVKTMKGSAILNIQEFVEANLSKKTNTLKTPLDVIANLKKSAHTSILLTDELLENKIENIDLKETLLDIKAMGFLGNYYAYKISGALALEYFKATEDSKYKVEAKKAIEEANRNWKVYAAINSPRYKSQNMSRIQNFDFSNRLQMAEKDLKLIEEAKTYSEEN